MKNKNMINEDTLEYFNEWNKNKIRELSDYYRQQYEYDENIYDDEYDEIEAEYEEI